jgi:hypothetical protein
MAGDEHIASDTVFGAHESLITAPQANDSASPFGLVPNIHFNFKLAAVPDAASGRVGADPSQLVKKDLS